MTRKWYLIRGRRRCVRLAFVWIADDLLSKAFRLSLELDRFQQAQKQTRRHLDKHQQTWTYGTTQSPIAKSGIIHRYRTFPRPQSLDQLKRGGFPQILDSQSPNRLHRHISSFLTQPIRPPPTDNVIYYTGSRIGNRSSPYWYKLKRQLPHSSWLCDWGTLKATVIIYIFTNLLLYEIIISLIHPVCILSSLHHYEQ